MKKVLIIRFSSIGDIVLTSPVIRSLKRAEPDTEIHYLTKSTFESILAPNPYLDRLHVLKKDNWHELIRELRSQGFDYILDLHHNLRTLRIKWALRRPTSSFNKENSQKFRMVRFKAKLEIPHIVDRYLDTLKPLGVSPDGKGLDFFVPPEAEAAAAKAYQENGFSQQPFAIVLGAIYKTKRWLPQYFIEFINKQELPVILIGGPDARAEADEILPNIQVPCLDGVGTYPLLTAAALMKLCRAVLTHDTGFMHIAAAFGMQIYSIWGNTVPEFGMTPYQSPHLILETSGLSCRPCSKIGFDSCPKGHFRCMNDLTPERVLGEIKGSRE